MKVIKTYNWQCMECKTCTICSQPHREDLLMFCDRCDRGYHTYCVSLRAIPSGVWVCSRCVHEDPDFKKRRRKEMRLLNSSPKPTSNQRKTYKLADSSPSDNHHGSPLLLERSNAKDMANNGDCNHSSPKSLLNSNNHTASGHERGTNAVDHVPAAKRKILNNKQLNHIEDKSVAIQQNGTSPHSQSHHKGNNNDVLLNNHHGRSPVSNNKLKKLSRKSIHGNNISMLKKEQIKTS